MVSIKAKLRFTEKSIDSDSLKNSIDKCRQEIRDLRNNLLINEAYLGVAELHLHQV